MLRATVFLKNVPKTTTKSFAQPKHFFDRYVAPRPPQQITTEESNLVKNYINQAVQADTNKFAVVQIGKKQYKVSEGDLVRLTDLPLNETVSKGAKYYTGKWVEAKIGEVIELSKILLVGGQNFSLVGRPVIPEDSGVKVTASVVEHTRGHMQVQTPWTLNLSKASISRVFRRKHTVLRILEIKTDSLK